MQVDRGVRLLPDVRKAARPAREQRLVVKSIGEPVGRDPLGIRPDRQQRHEIADATRQVEPGRSAVRTRCEQTPDAGIDGHEADPEGLELGHREEPEVGQGMVHTRATEGPEHRELCRTHGARGKHRELGVRLVLVGPRPLDGYAGRLKRPDAGLAQRITIADPAIDLEPEWPGMTRAPIRRDDPRPGLEPTGPCGIEGGPRTDLSVGEDDDLHGSDANGLWP